MKKITLSIVLIATFAIAPSAYAWGLFGTLAHAYEHHVEHHYYQRHYNGYYSDSGPNCSQFNINTQASQPMGPVSMPPGGCHVRMSNGYPIPDPNCTPGAINPTVTLKVLTNRSFRTKCIRNKATSEQQKFVMYRRYGIRHPYHNYGSSQTCEIDHLIPLEMGGADTFPNLWVQCGPSGVQLNQRNFRIKDLVENYLTQLVKQGRMPLIDAQRGIATNWTQFISAAQKYCGNNRYCD